LIATGVLQVLARVTVGDDASSRRHIFDGSSDVEKGVNIVHARDPSGAEHQRVDLIRELKDFVEAGGFVI